MPEPWLAFRFFDGCLSECAEQVVARHSADYSGIEPVRQAGGAPRADRGIRAQ